MSKKHNYGVIMAGGVGSRFWPMSTSSFPKQFHDVLGVGQTLLRMTFERLRKICEAEHILVVTNAKYKDLVMEQIPEIPENNILCEPFMRNTAPCLAYANFKIESQDPEANIIVAPADHLILKEDEFIETLKIALNTAENEGALVTLGIKPSRPDTGYGYIQFRDDEKSDERVKRVKTFTEKPTASLANIFLESGEYYWNSGMFIWKLSSIQETYKQLLPDMYAAFEAGRNTYNTSEEDLFIRNTYSTCENISVDYGIMEKADLVYVVLSDFGWSDLGTWGSLYTHLDRDEKENSTVGKNVVLYNSSNNMVFMPEDKLAVIQGLDDYIIVDSNGILLICKKEDEQRIKEFVNDVKINKGDLFV